MKNFIVAGVVALTLSLGLVSHSNAQISLDVQQSDDAGFSTYILSLTSSAGNVASFEGLFLDGNAFEGNLAQQSLGGGTVTSPTTDLNGAIDVALDSQFLFGSADLLAATAPFESPNSLGGVFTLNAGARQPTLEFVQIVAPVGEEIAYNFRIGEAIGATANSQDFSGVLGFVIPEPTTLALAGLGLCGLLSTRRRRS